MKIALICTEKLPVPPVSGGAIQIYIKGILPELSKHHEITVFSIKHESLPDEEEINGVKYIRVAAESNKNDYIRNVELKLDDSYDLIHVFNRPRWVVRLSKKFPKTKFSLSLHNEMFHEEKIPRDMGLTCVKQVQFITTVSKFIADGVVKLFPEAEGKIYTVYSGVDPDVFKPAMSEEGKQNKAALKKKFGIEDKKVVLFVGRLGEKKGADKLITAMKSVMEKRSDVALVIIGSKWYGENTADDYSKSVAELSKTLNGPVVFTGYLPHEAMPAYYNLGDIFVCPSQWSEPLARVHYEAMAAGLPIITTNRGGNKEVIEGFGNGIVIDDFSNPDAFAGQILSLLDDPAKASAMGQKGRKLAEERFGWDRVSRELLALFKIAEESKQVQYQEASEQASEENEAIRQGLPEQASDIPAEENKGPEQSPPEPPEASAVESEAPKQALPELASDIPADEIKAPEQRLPKPPKASADESKAPEQALPEQASDIPADEIKAPEQKPPKPPKASEVENKASKQALPELASDIPADEIKAPEQRPPKPPKASVVESKVSKQALPELVSYIPADEIKAPEQRPPKPPKVSADESKVSKQALPELVSYIPADEIKAPEQRPPKPPKASVVESKASKQASPETVKIIADENKPPKQSLPEPLKESAVENKSARKGMPKHSFEISIGVNRAANRVLNKNEPETDVEANNIKAADKENHETFYKMIRSRHPGMPDDVIEYLKGFEAYFLRGELW